MDLGVLLARLVWVRGAVATASSLGYCPSLVVAAQAAIVTGAARAIAMCPGSRRYGDMTVRCVCAWGGRKRLRQTAGAHSHSHALRSLGTVVAD